jgi:nicotinate phosphoribosyltransferase
MTEPISLDRGDALLLVDVQNDFLPGGALAVPGGDEIVPVLNRYLARFARQCLPVFATRDWHPRNHCSFQGRGGHWPPHCVQETRGAEFSPALNLPANALVVSKGDDPDAEAYSGFAGTNLEAGLRAAGVRRVFVGGLATDYCVLGTVRDACARGFEVVLLRDAIRAVDSGPQDGLRAEEEMHRLGAVPIEIGDLIHRDPGASALLTDLYELTMLQAYYDGGMEKEAVFEFYVRRLPGQRNFLVAAGLEQVLDYLEDLRFFPSELAWLESTGRFTPRFLERMEKLRFTGGVQAMAEGTVFFPNEPILRVVAPMPEAQLVETRVLNLLHFQTAIASKAARCVLAAPGKSLVDFGLRRAHGAEAALLAARAAYLAGFEATSNVLAGRQFGIPLSGTMAHSFVEAADREEAAFLAFARANPGNVVFLIDTYDTEAAAAKVVELAPALRAEGLAVGGIRLDSGDLADHARRVRDILDRGGLKQTRIFASGNLDEFKLQKLSAAGAPIDGYGVGTRLVTSADAPYLDCAYKLQEYAGRPRGKRAEGKATLPGRKQVHRRCDEIGQMEGDLVSQEGEPVSGKPLIGPVMEKGRRVGAPPPLSAARQRLLGQIERLPARLRSLDAADPYSVRISSALAKMADQPFG